VRLASEVLGSFVQFFELGAQPLDVATYLLEMPEEDPKLFAVLFRLVGVRRLIWNGHDDRATPLATGQQSLAAQDFEGAFDRRLRRTKAFDQFTDRRERLADRKSPSGDISSQLIGDAYVDARLLGFPIRRMSWSHGA
jgi:hypothetical protein